MTTAANATTATEGLRSIALTLYGRPLCVSGELPERVDWILRDQFIGREDRQAVDDGLADQHAVERVGVKVR